jgi:hypothetical protein
MGIMRRFRTAVMAGCLCLVLAGPARAQTPALLWGKQFNGGGIPSAYTLALHSSNLWVGGNYAGSIDLGGASYTSPQNSYLAMFSTDGVYQWSRAFNVGSGTLVAMGADASDNVYLTGQFSGTIDFGGTPLVSLGGYDIFLAKFNSAGVHQWSKRFGDASSSDGGLALVIDNANNVIIGGRFSGTTDFGGGGLISAGGTDAFIAKFSGTGAYAWAKKFGDANNQEVDGLASSSGDVYAVGSYFGTINLGGSNLTSVGQNDVFLARFNSLGAQAWSKSFGDATFQYGIDVDTDGSAVYLLANFLGAVNFGGGSLASAGGQDIAVARFSPSGVHLWSRSFGDSNSQSAAGLDLFGGSLAVTGFFQGTIDFGSGHSLFAGVSNSDAFLARLLASDGSELWSQHFGLDINSDYGSDVVMDGSAVYIGGRFDKDIELGYNGSLSSPDRTTEAYLAKFALLPLEPSIRTIQDVPDDQGGRVRVEFDGQAYDALTSPLPIRSYEVYLREDPLTAAAAGASNFGETWLLAGAAPAHAFFRYYTLAFTQQDSTLATGPHRSVYKLRATTDDPSLYFESKPRDGFSIDNLAPAIPLNLVIAEGELSWHAPADADLAYYTVYGSAGAFDASAQLIDYTAATHMDVGSRAYAHYFVTATDRAGNEGKPASLDGAKGGMPATPRTLSVSAYPNPFNPETTIRYTLPAAGHVHVDVFDATGSHVRTLVNREQIAGAFTATWDGHDQMGRASASGIYFARIQHNGATRAYKLVMLK